MREKFGKNLEVTDLLVFPDLTTRYHFEAEVSDFFRMNLTVTPIKSLGFTHTSRKIMLTNDAGKYYVLKQKPIYSEEYSRREFAANLQNTLSSALDFVPPVITGANGRNYFEWCGRYLFMSPYVDGDVYTGLRSEENAIVPSLQKIHSASRKSANRVIESVPSAPRQAFLEAPLNLIRLIYERITDEYNDYLAIANKLGIIHGELIQLIRHLDANDEIPIHGDVSPFNVLYRNRNVSAILDFDNASVGRAERDIAILALTHSQVFYLGETSTMRTPILTEFMHSKTIRIWNMYKDSTTADVNIRSFYIEMAIYWVELMALGLVRGEYTPEDVFSAISIIDEIVECSGA